MRNYDQIMQICHSKDLSKPLTDDERQFFIKKSLSSECLFDWVKAARHIAASQSANAWMVQKTAVDESVINRVKIFEKGRIIDSYDYTRSRFGGYHEMYYLELEGQKNLIFCTSLAFERSNWWSRTSWPTIAVNELSRPALRVVK